MVCDEHDFDLNSNKDSSHGLILKLKEGLQAKTKVIENISRNYRIMETEYSKLQANYEGLLQDNKVMTQMKPLRKRTRIM